MFFFNASSVTFSKHTSTGQFSEPRKKYQSKMKKGYLVNKSSQDWKLLVGSTDTYWVIFKKKSNQASTNLEGRLHSSSKQHFYSTKTKTWQPKVAAPASSVLSSSCCRCRARPYSQWSASTNFQREIPSNSQRLNSFANILGKCLKLIFSIVVLNTIHFYWCQMGSLEFCLSKP